MEVGQQEEEKKPCTQEDKATAHSMVGGTTREGIVGSIESARVGDAEIGDVYAFGVIIISPYWSGRPLNHIGKGGRTELECDVKEGDVGFLVVVADDVGVVI